MLNIQEAINRSCYVNAKEGSSMTLGVCVHGDQGTREDILEMVASAILRLALHSMPKWRLSQGTKCPVKWLTEVSSVTKG